MITQQKILEIAEKLLERSKNDEVIWNQESRKDGQTHYYVKFPESRFDIAFVSPSTELDHIDMCISDKDRKVVAEISVPEHMLDPSWKLALDLYSEADRYVMGWDKTFIEIEAELKKEGRIGLKGEKEQRIPS